MEESAQLYKNILENLYDGVYYLDRDKRVTFWNKGAERLTGYRSIDVLGRISSDRILAHINEEGKSVCRNDCPAEKTIQDGRTREAEMFFRHKKGHNVPVMIRVSPIRDDKGNIIGAVQIFSDNVAKLKLKRQIADLHRQSLLDPLTQLANRRALGMFLDERRQELQRYGWPFGVLFVDIDHFKRVNDQYGHEVGDEVLKMVANTLSSNKRSFDIVGRWGGEEFLAIVINVDRDDLKRTGERFRHFVEGARFIDEKAAIGVTVSIGATLCLPEDDADSLVRRADELMYRCKKEGRNCVRIS